MTQIGEISVEISADISDLQRDLQRATSSLSDFGSTMQSIGQRMGNAFDGMTRGIERAADGIRDMGRRGREMGESMIDMSENLMQGLTLPLAALSAASIKASLDMSRLGSIVKANMAGVKGSIEEVQGVAERVFLQGLGKSAEDVGRTVANLKREFDTLNATQLESLAVQIHGVAEALGTDAAGVLEDVIELTDKYKITTQQALDLVAAGYDAASLEGKNLSNVLKEVNGTASEMSKTMQNDPTVKWRGNLRELMATLAPLGDELLRFANDILPSVTSAIKSAVDWFGKQSTATKNAIISIAGLLAILPLVTMTLGALIMTGSSVLSFFGTLGGWLTRAGTAVVNFFKNFKNVGMLGRIAGPIGVAVTALTLLYNKSKEFASFVNTTFKGVWDGLKNTFSNLSSSIEPLKASLSTMGTAFSNLWTAIQPVALGIGVVLVMAIVAVMAVINGLLNALAPLIGVIINIVTAVASLVSAFVSLLMLDFSGFLEGINGFVEAFVSILMGLVDTVIALFTGMWSMLVSVFAAFGVNLNAVAVSIFTALWNFIVMIGTAIGTFLVALWNNTKANAIAIWNALKAGVMAIWNGIKTAASTAWNAVKNAVVNAVNAIKTRVTAVWNGIKNTISNVLNAVKSKVTTIWNGIKNSISNAMSSIKTKISNGFNSAKNAVSNAANAIKTKLSGLAKSALTWGSNLGSMFAKGLKSAINKAVDAARNAAAKIKGFLGWSSPTKEGPGRDSDKWAPNLMNMLASGIQAGIPKLQTSVTQVASVISNVQPTEGTASNVSSPSPTVNVYPQRANLNPAQLMRELQRASRLNGGRFI